MCNVYGGWMYLPSNSINWMSDVQVHHALQILVSIDEMSQYDIVPSLRSSNEI
jgi:hypothetical protein